MKLVLIPTAGIHNKVSRQSYADFLRANIFDPLRMKDSGVETSTNVISQQASGYTLDHGQLAAADYINMSSAYSAGAIYSTAEDLLRWEQGLFGGGLLSAEALKKMTTPFKNGYACGLHVDEQGGQKVIYHSGRVDGFSAHLAYYPEEKLVVVTLSNVWNREMATIASQLAAVARGQKVSLSSIKSPARNGVIANRPGHDFQHRRTT